MREVTKQRVGVERLFHLFIDLIINASCDILVRCQAVLQVLDPSLVTLRNDL